MGSQEVEIFLAFIGIGLGAGAAYGFTSAVIAEIASYRRERRLGR